MRLLRTAIAATGVLVGGLVAGCGAGSVSGSAGGEEETDPPPVELVEVEGTPLPETASLPPEVPEGHVHVHGIAFAATSDPPTPDRPFDGGTIVAVPLRRFQDYRRDVTGPWRGAVLEGRNFPVPLELAGAGHAGRAELAKDGTYDLFLHPGTYAFCLGNLGGTRAAAASETSVWVDKWIEVTITREPFQTVILILNRATGEITVFH